MEHQGLGRAGGATVAKGACSRDTLATDREGSALCGCLIEHGYPPTVTTRGKETGAGGVNLYQIIEEKLRLLQAHVFLLFQEFLITLKTSL